MDRNMRREHGNVLREARKAMGMTLLDVSGVLDLSVGFLSDIERGQREPLRGEHIQRLASVFPPEYVRKLSETAITSRGAFSISLDRSDEFEMAAAAALLRSWSKLSPEQFGEIKRVVDTEGS